MYSNNRDSDTYIVGPKDGVESCPCIAWHVAPRLFAESHSLLGTPLNARVRAKSNSQSLEGPMHPVCCDNQCPVRSPMLARHLLSTCHKAANLPRAPHLGLLN